MLTAYDNRGTSILSTAYAAYHLVTYLTSNDEATRYCYVEHGLTAPADLPPFFTVPVRYSREAGANVSNVSELLANLSDAQRSTLFAEVKANIQAAHDYFASK